MTFFVDFAEIRDIQAIHAFQIAHAQEVEGLTLDSARVRQGVEQVFEQPNLGFYLVARALGECPGHDSSLVLGSLLVTREWSDWRAKMVWWIQSVYVRPEWRKKGVFAAMYAHVEDLAHKQDVAGLRLYVEKNNLGAKKVYAKLGMSDTHYDMFEKFFSN